MKNIERSIQHLLRCKKMNIIKKIGKYAFIIGIILIFVIPFLPEPWVTYLHYFVTACFILGYIESLINEYEKKHHISISSMLLFLSSSAYLIITLFYNSPYISLIGQVIIYMYLLNSGKKIMGYFNKKVMILAAVAVLLNYAKITYKSTILNFAYIAFQFLILYKFFDPLLEKIALDHRAKRLAIATEEKNIEIKKESLLD